MVVEDVEGDFVMYVYVGLGEFYVFGVLVLFGDGLGVDLIEVDGDEDVFVFCLEYFVLEQGEFVFVDVCYGWFDVSLMVGCLDIIDVWMNLVVGVDVFYDFFGFVVGRFYQDGCFVQFQNGWIVGVF